MSGPKLLTAGNDERLLMWGMMTHDRSFVRHLLVPVGPRTAQVVQLCGHSAIAAAQSSHVQGLQVSSLPCSAQLPPHSVVCVPCVPVIVDGTCECHKIDRLSVLLADTGTTKQGALGSRQQHPRHSPGKGHLPPVSHSLAVCQFLWKFLVQCSHQAWVVRALAKLGCLRPSR